MQKKKTVAAAAAAARKRRVIITRFHVRKGRRNQLLGGSIAPQIFTGQLILS